MTATILDLVEAQLRDKGEVDPGLAEVAWAIKRMSDLAWDESSERRARLDNLAGEFHRGRAHAFCDVLGDQAALLRLLPDPT